MNISAHPSHNHHPFCLFSWEWAAVCGKQAIKQQRKEDFGGEHKAHTLSQSCIPQNGNEENFTSWLLPYQPILVSGWFLSWCQENQSIPSLLQEVLTQAGSSWCPLCLGFRGQPSASNSALCQLCKAVRWWGRRKTSLTLAGDQFTNSSMRFNYPFHYLSLHSSECEPSMNQRNSQQLLLWERGR